jgi:hypothetical protein
MTLEEIFANCVKKIGNNNKAIQRFVIEAKQADPTVTVGEVKDIAGFNIEDVDGDFETDEERKEAVERKQASLNQKWRNNIMEPVKSAILAKMFPDKTVADVWGREADDEAKKIREQLEDKYLPKRSRASSATTNFDHLADLF